MQRILITGAAGFIGFNLTARFLSEGKSVIGIDSMLDNNDLWLKQIRLDRLLINKNFKFIREKVTHKVLKSIGNKIDLIIHLAAISGIERFERDRDRAERITKESAKAVARYASERKIPIIYASSSSVYGRIEKKKFREDIARLRPISAYAKTKIFIEEIFQSVNNFSIGLRFFTVYGEYGRRDMAYFRFAERILRNEPVVIFGKGIKRDFTYIDDVVEAIVLIIKNLNTIPRQRQLIINIGRGKAERLEKMVFLLGKYLNKSPVIIYNRPRRFDMPYTCSDNRLLKAITGFTPQTDIERGLKRFTDWFKHNYQKTEDR